MIWHASSAFTKQLRVQLLMAYLRVRAKLCLILYHLNLLMGCPVEQPMPMHPAIQLALDCQQLTPQQAWELDLVQWTNLELNRQGHLLMAWCLLLACQTHLLTRN